MNTIITIGRQFGSGGHEIGRLLAQALDIPCYDKELIVLAAQKSGMSPDVFSHVDETATNSFLYSVSAGSIPGTAYQPAQSLPLNDKLFIDIFLCLFRSVSTHKALANIHLHSAV